MSAAPPPYTRGVAEIVDKTGRDAHERKQDAARLQATGAGKTIVDPPAVSQEVVGLLPQGELPLDKKTIIHGAQPRVRPGEKPLVVTNLPKGTEIGREAAALSSNGPADAADAYLRKHRAEAAMSASPAVAAGAPAAIEALFEAAPEPSTATGWGERKKASAPRVARMTSARGRAAEAKGKGDALIVALPPSTGFWRDSKVDWARAQSRTRAGAPPAAPSQGALQGA